MSGIFFLAIAAGVLTILAPCILPILPFLLGTSGGKSALRPFMIIVGFVLSFSVLGAAFAPYATYPEKNGVAPTVANCGVASTPISA